MRKSFDPLTLHPSLIEAASWRLCSELARRHPGQLRIVELHPGGGQYDCLSLIASGEPPSTVLDANREGSIHANPASDDEHVWTWTDYLTARDQRGFLIGVEDAIGLSPPDSVPPADAATLAWRVIALALSTEVLGVRELRAVNGMIDSSDGGSATREELFDVFPGAFEALRSPTTADDVIAEPAYRFWFLLRGDEPVVAIESDTAQSWWRDGTQFDLFADYARNGRHLTSTAARGLAPAVR